MSSRPSQRDATPLRVVSPPALLGNFAGGRYAELDDSEAAPEGAEAGAQLGEVTARWRWYAVATAVVFGGILMWGSRESGQQPTWEVTKLTLDYLDLPGLQGLIPADNSACPADDPCGIGRAKGCSLCPAPRMWNDGCLCRKDLKGHSAPAGEVVQADTSACPQTDPCGVSSSRGCARCPDSTWINDGCSCHQPPLSAKEFFNDVDDFFSSILGLQPTVIKMRLRADAVVTNPADIGARAQDGVFNISYRGFPIGSAEMLPVDVPARGSAIVSADVQVDHVPASTGALMLNELLNHRTLLPVLVTGSSLAICGPFKVWCEVRCDLVADVSALPKARFAQKACSYSYKSVSV